MAVFAEWAKNELMSSTYEGIDNKLHVVKQINRAPRGGAKLSYFKVWLLVIAVDWSLS